MPKENNTIPLYIRDLNPTLRAEIEADIRRSRNMLLIGAMDDGTDIRVGAIYRPTYYQISNS